MTPAITLWLSFVLSAGFVAWFGTRRQAIAFAIAAIATAPATLLPLGHPTFLAPPPGQHTVLGARIDQDVAIYVLLDGPTPRYYVLPFSQGAANDLQSAQDAAADGEGGVAMTMGEDGSPGFSEATPPEEPDKQAERPMIGG